MGFIIAFLAIVIYVVLCAVFAQSLPLTSFYVYEDKGRYARSKAKWQFIISVNEI